jgi:hypothetical protein
MSIAHLSNFPELQQNLDMNVYKNSAIFALLKNMELIVPEEIMATLKAFN